MAQRGGRARARGERSRRAPKNKIFSRLCHPLGHVVVYFEWERGEQEEKKENEKNSTTQRGLRSAGKVSPLPATSPRRSAPRHEYRDGISSSPDTRMRQSRDTTSRCTAGCVRFHLDAYHHHRWYAIFLFFSRFVLWASRTPHAPAAGVVDPQDTVTRRFPLSILPTTRPAHAGAAAIPTADMLCVCVSVLCCDRTEKREEHTSRFRAVVL